MAGRGRHWGPKSRSGHNRGEVAMGSSRIIDTTPPLVRELQRVLPGAMAPERPAPKERERGEWLCACGRWHRPLRTGARNTEREMLGLACPLCGSLPPEVTP